MNKQLRNIAVIAHVDHGKTTLIDALLKQTHTFRENEAEMSQTTILDSNDLERERGITILAKNVAIDYQDVKINIIDTPGHADFSGEVERTLGMADGALLIVDAQEGPMPQTRFVLKKALELGLKIILIINKIDKRFARPAEVLNKTSNLFLELATNEDQLDFPVLYAIGREGKVFADLPQDYNQPGNVAPLLDVILKYIPEPRKSSDTGFKMLVSSLDYDRHLGRIVIGRIFSGNVTPGKKVIETSHPEKVNQIEFVFESQGLTRIKVEEANQGDIIALSGLDQVTIGETIAEPGDTLALPSAKISEPTLHMELGPNTSPFSGKEGEFTTARQIEERLYKELEKNLSLRVEKTDNGKFRISGRGELHLAILLETLRREGFEMEVGKPEVITKRMDGVLQEPVEEVDIVVPNEYVGTINQEIGKRFGVMHKMEPASETETEFLYTMPTRSLIGLRGVLLVATRGTAIVNSQFLKYEPVGKTLPKLRRGALIAFESGTALAYGLEAAQSRGETFIDPGSDVYEGMIVGQNAKDEDIEINVTKGKKLSNMRSKSSDGIIQLAPPTKLTLEQSLGFLESDELLEITPKSLRLRKRYLTTIERKKQRRS